MPRFRKKPVEIEAEQWFPGKEISGVKIDHHCIDADGNLLAFIETPEGRMTVGPGDWVITGVKGERYPCKPDIFEATYERVGERVGERPTVHAEETMVDEIWG